MNDLFLRACRNEAVERPPVWIMRQAGRYLAEYRAIRERGDFLTLCRTPELAAEVTLQPVRLIGVDAAILFADILLPLDAMGAGLYFVKGEGPRFERPVRNEQEAKSLAEIDPERDLGYVMETVRRVRKELADSVPLIGFAGTPWTLATYLVEGGPSKNYANLLAWSYSDPVGLRRILSFLARGSARYLSAQVAAGAQALQLFDSWGGILSAERWREIAMPSLLEVIENIEGDVPLIFYVNGGSHLLPVLRDLPVQVLSVDWRIPLDQARAIVGPDKVLQGNLDPGALLGSSEEIVNRTRAMLAAGAGGGHIANLGHGILPMTDPDKARLFVDTVKNSAG
jgi:uroporphyrinogen decarboxylase